MSTVELRAIGKRYGAAQVIQGIDLSVPHGELVALVGPSGCGKSTVLRMIAGLEEISDGEILIDGKVVNGKRPRERNIAMVFQNYALYPHMSVRDNMTLNMRISRLPRDEIADRVAKAADLLDITALLDRKPAQLSGGQRQRVAMGRAIVRDPSAFLFDEPLSNLDAKLRVQMRSEIKALHQKVGTTSIYVTHDQIEAMTLANRIVVMNAGRIEQVGTPIALYARPCNVFVAGFIGSPAMNLLPARATDEGTRATLAEGRSVVLPPCTGGMAGRGITLGIRPEHVVLDRDTAMGYARVTGVEPTGAQTFLQADIAGTALTIVADGARRFDVGNALALELPRDDLHVFDRTTGQRLNLDTSATTGAEQ